MLQYIDGGSGDEFPMWEINNAQLSPPPPMWGGGGGGGEIPHKEEQ